MTTRRNESITIAVKWNRLTQTYQKSLARQKIAFFFLFSMTFSIIPGSGELGTLHLICTNKGIIHIFRYFPVHLQRNHLLLLIQMK